jgi:hypothetical protein
MQFNKNAVSLFLFSLNINKKEDYTMARFLIEVPHGSDKDACVLAIQVFLQTGSHFLTHADWGCMDGEHKAWIIADFSSKEEAKYILPPVFLSAAKITQLTTFTAKDFAQPDDFHEKTVSKNHGRN